MTPRISRTALNAANLSALTALAMAVGLLAAWPAMAQVAGTTTTVGVSVTETTLPALGWSVKKTLLGKTVYSDGGQKIGKLEDLIVDPARNVSYVIVGAGGFVGIGRHDVAVPVSRIRNEAGRLVMSGATKDQLKAMPAFDYTNDSAQRDRFIAAADRDIAEAKARLATLEKAASSGAADVKASLDSQAASLKVDLKATEDKLAELRQATSRRWKEFEASVNAATARLRKAVASIKG